MYAKSFGLGGHDRQTHAVDGDRALGRNLSGITFGEAEPELTPLSQVVTDRDFADGVDVPGHQMPAELVVHPQRAFEVHRAAGLQLAERRSRERLGAGLKVEHAVGHRDDGQATAAHADAIAERGIGGDRLRRDAQPPPRRYFEHRDDGGFEVDEAGEHESKGEG